MPAPSKLTIRKGIDRADPQDIARFQEAPTGWVVDAMGRRGALPHWIKPISKRTRFVGTALTVQTRPVDNLAPYAALKFAKPGDVLVVSADGSETAAVLGDILLGMARNAGIVAAVTDGMVRDIGGINDVGIPTFARGLTPNSPFKDGPGSIGLPVTLGGIAVASGDLIIGDDDGVVVVPKNRLGETADALAAIAEKEASMDKAVEQGATHPPWLEEILASDAVRYVD